VRPPPGDRPALPARLHPPRRGPAAASRHLAAGSRPRCPPPIAALDGGGPPRRRAARRSLAPVPPRLGRPLSLRPVHLFRLDPPLRALERRRLGVVPQRAGLRPPHRTG